MSISPQDAADPVPSEAALPPEPPRAPRERFAHPFELGTIAVVIVLDQITKFLVRGSLEYGESRTIVPGLLDLVHVQNTGAAFGMLNNVDFPYKPVVMVGVAFLALLAIAAYGAQLGFHDRLARFGLALILGGAFGNLLDRAIAGHVLDFVDIYYGDVHFWAFNVADTAITMGAILVILDTIGVGGSMHPILFEIGGFPVYTYGVLLAAAYLLGLQFALVRARARGLDANRVMDLGIWIIISALIGAKLLLLIVDFDTFRQHPRELLMLMRSGGVFYGGLIAAVAVAFWYLRRHRLPMWSVCDAFAPGIALGHVIGRMGCFFAGCCFGKSTDVPWAVTFTSEYANQNVGTPLNVPLHPTQLYEAGAELAILGLLLWLERRLAAVPRPDVLEHLLVYGVTRFIIEFYRGDARGMIGDLSTSQFVSVLLVPLSIVMLIVLARRPLPDPKMAAKRARAA